MDHFELVSEYQPTGDQPQAIEQLVKGFKEGNQLETLLGVTGSGKTFTMAIRIIPVFRTISSAYPLTWTLSSIIFIVFLLRMDWDARV